ncbi:MAG: shikimate kinase [Anaerovoracaceae bacterium]|nr:shikimate kinase [Bacillota bacterium]MDY2671418.1 shikimate kinase [Anaerovoracaceae bacterium]
MNNFVLIGMPACGKSTFGVVLAKALGMSFADTDLMIQKKTGRLLQDIIDKDGMDAFLKIEDEVLSEVELDNTVIATGGSAVYSDRGMKHLGESGTIVYIELPFKEIDRRLNNIKTRGIAMAPGQTLKDLYDLRVPLYEKYADVTLDTAGMNLEDSVEEFMKKMDIEKPASAENFKRQK